jgi:acyl dehydratase
VSRRVLGPGRYGLDELRPGDVIDAGRKQVTAGMIDTFADMTGDRFEIHMTVEGARRHGFSGRVAHGLLVLSLVDGLKNQAPAQFDAMASLGWDWRFDAPVLAGDMIGVTITVKSLRPTSDGKRGIATLDFDVKNQRGETVQTGENRLMIYA